MKYLSPLLPPEKIIYIQKVVGTFLYYATSSDNTLLTALNESYGSLSPPITIQILHFSSLSGLWLYANDA